MEMDFIVDRNQREWDRFDGILNSREANRNQLLQQQQKERIQMVLLFKMKSAHDLALLIRLVFPI